MQGQGGDSGTALGGGERDARAADMGARVRKSRMQMRRLSKPGAPSEEQSAQAQPQPQPRLQQEPAPKHEEQQAAMQPENNMAAFESTSLDRQKVAVGAEGAQHSVQRPTPANFENSKPYLSTVTANRPETPVAQPVEEHFLVDSNFDEMD
eukprot:1854799-Pleurochrysis_carterae.AAC.2